jgi:hypothetical protein
LVTININIPPQLLKPTNKQTNQAVFQHHSNSSAKKLRNSNPVLFLLLNYPPTIFRTKKNTLLAKKNCKSAKLQKPSQPASDPASQPQLKLSKQKLFKTISYISLQNKEANLRCESTHHSRLK